MVNFKDHMGIDFLWVYEFVWIEENSLIIEEVGWTEIFNS